MSTTPAKWNQGLLLITTAGPAGISLISSFVALKFLGTEAFGQWLAWRGLFLLLAIPTPGFSVAQQVLIAEALAADDPGRAGRIQRYCDVRSLSWVVIGSTAIFVVYLSLGAPWQRAGAVAVLFAGLYLAAYTTSTIIGRRDSIRTVRGAFADVAGGLGTIATAIFAPLEMYVAAMGVRYLLKAAFQYGRPLAASKPSALPADDLGEETRRVGIPMMLRAFVRDASQYGDKPLLSALYGNLIAGVAGVGSILATFAVMFANTATSYLLPVLISTDPAEHGKLSRSALMKVIHAMLVFAACIPAAHFVNAKIASNLDIVGLTYFVISGLSLLSPIVVPWTAKGQIWRGTFWTGTLILIVAAILLGFGWAGLTVQGALAICIVLVFTCVGLILKDTEVVRGSSLRVGLASAAIGGAAVGFSLAVPHLPQPASGVLLPLLGAGYGAWVLRRRFWRRTAL